MFGIFGKKREQNHLLVITLDSCRWDSFMAAEPSNIARLCGGLENVERRFSYASWTAPSHYNLLTGLVPHVSPEKVYASEYYKEDLYKFKERLGVEEAGFEAMIPHLWLPSYLKAKGYETNAMVSLPVLNPATGINNDFDTFKLMPKHNDMLAMLDGMEEHMKTRESKGLKGNTPQFYLMNVGETHYPYALPDEDKNDLPHISGVNGIFKKLDNQINEEGNLVSDNESGNWMDMDQIEQCRDRQIKTVKYLDEVVFPRLYDMVPKDTWVIVTADHGELFGEAGYFGHGPIMHEKVFEVPFLEGKIR
ncbi:MAG: sulfatase-like hydrolase/transferase [Planctomycetes bacterium]|nr:sulfatase-like hydrolase/transferase [Planctomycetota bacterium]